MQPQYGNGSRQSQETIDLGPSIRVLQLNIEGISHDKCKHLSRLAKDNNINFITLQETHLSTESELQTRANVRGYKIIAKILSDVCKSIVLVRDEVSEFKVTSTNNDNNIGTITIELSGLCIISVYKPPNIKWATPPSHPK